MPIGQVVEELSAQYPDVTHSSLRFLEREKLVEPERTAGGHRLYSQSDINRIRQIKEWQEQRLSLEDIRRRLDALDRLPSPEELSYQFLELAVAGDQSGAQHLILQADELGMPLEVIFQEVLSRALYETGERWEHRRLKVGQEKEISQLSRDIIAELSVRHTADLTTGKVTVAACVGGEYHELGLRMVAGMLQSRGYPVHFLGPSVDPAFLVEVIQLRNPQVVLLTATLDDRLPDVREAIAAIQRTFPEEQRPAIVVGGQITDSFGEQIRDWGARPAENDHVEVITDAVIDCFL